MKHEYNSWLYEMFNCSEAFKKQQISHLSCSVKPKWVTQGT